MTDMRERQISDLLACRDGERGEADAAEVLARPGATKLLGELERLQQALRSLPDPTPDAGSWERIRNAARPVPVRHDRAGTVLRCPGLFVPYAAAAGLTLALAAGLLAVHAARDGAATGAVGERPSTTQPVAKADPALESLYERSRRLEPLLVSADRRDPMEQALRLRIADLDGQITGIPDSAASRQQEERLWGQRVALLESLAQVRRARATLQPAVY